ncbi:MAG TPA: RNA 2',3'-cyclic phosphodiesterase [Bryobacteraceae bacterium]|jgi:2'-5' RNA ligase
MRLFTGLDLPEEIVGNLKSLLQHLRPAAHISWSPPENLHITTKFIGEWPEERLEQLKSALDSIAPRDSITVHIRKLGFFPNPHAPRVFWCGIDAPGLEALAAATDRSTSSLGIPAEARAFSPHLTLARIKERINLQSLRETIAGLDSLDFGQFVADRFFLYHSRPGPKGSVYTKLAECKFSNQ